MQVKRGANYLFSLRADTASSDYLSGLIVLRQSASVNPDRPQQCKLRYISILIDDIDRTTAKLWHKANTDLGKPGNDGISPSGNFHIRESTTHGGRAT